MSLTLGRTGRAAPSERVRDCRHQFQRGRGYDHSKLFAANPQCEVVAVCDVDDAMFAKPVKVVESSAASRLGRERLRRLLDDKTIDAIAVATPDHWHAPDDRSCLPGR